MEIIVTNIYIISKIRVFLAGLICEIYINPDNFNLSKEVKQRQLILTVCSCHVTYAFRSGQIGQMV